MTAKNPLKVNNLSFIIYHLLCWSTEVTHVVHLYKMMLILKQCMVLFVLDVYCVVSNVSASFHIIILCSIHDTTITINQHTHAHIYIPTRGCDCMVVRLTTTYAISAVTTNFRIALRRDVLDTTLCDKVCQWLATGWWFPLPIWLTVTI